MKIRLMQKIKLELNLIFQLICYFTISNPNSNIFIEIFIVELNKVSRENNRLEWEEEVDKGNWARLDCVYIHLNDFRYVDLSSKSLKMSIPVAYYFLFC